MSDQSVGSIRLNMRRADVFQDQARFNAMSASPWMGSGRYGILRRAAFIQVRRDRLESEGGASAGARDPSSAGRIICHEVVAS